MGGPRLVRVPSDTYRRAVEMQQQLFNRNKVKVPIWRCMIMVEEEGKPKPQDPLWRLRL